MKRDEFARNLAAGTFDLIVMDVLHRAPNYGYGILKLILKRSKGSIRWYEGTLYPVLHRLERRGLLVGKWNFPKRGHERRYYRLTTRGQHVWCQQRDQWRSFHHDVNRLLEL